MNTTGHCPNCDSPIYTSTRTGLVHHVYENCAWRGGDHLFTPSPTSPQYCTFCGGLDRGQPWHKPKVR
jgi:hypothetical protein